MVRPSAILSAASPSLRRYSGGGDVTATATSGVVVVTPTGSMVTCHAHVVSSKARCTRPKERSLSPARRADHTWTSPFFFITLALCLRLKAEAEGNNAEPTEGSCEGLERNPHGIGGQGPSSQGNTGACWLCPLCFVVHSQRGSVLSNCHLRVLCTTSKPWEF